METVDLHRQLLVVHFSAQELARIDDLVDCTTRGKFHILHLEEATREGVVKAAVAHLLDIFGEE